MKFKIWQGAVILAAAVVMALLTDWGHYELVPPVEFTGDAFMQEPELPTEEPTAGVEPEEDLIEEADEPDFPDDGRMETDRVENPSGSLEFFFRSEYPVFASQECEEGGYCQNSSNPFELYFNSYYSGFVAEEAYVARGEEDRWEPHQVVQAMASDTETGETKQLDTLGGIWRSLGAVRVAGWIDDDHLLVRAGAGDGLVSNKYFYGISVNSGSRGQPIIENYRGWDDGRSYRRRVAVGALEVYQDCEDSKGSCDDILIYLGTPEDAEYPYENVSPAGRVASGEPLGQTSDEDATEYFQSGEERLRLVVGENGALEINVATGEVISTDNR